MKTTIASLLASALALSASNATTIYIEAESGNLGGNFQVTSDSLANGNSYIESTASLGGVAPATADQVASYQVTISVGTYDLYVRCFIENPNPATNDSFYVGNGFGSKTLGQGSDWFELNTLTNLDNIDGSRVTSGSYTWINMTSESAVPQFTTLGGTETLEIGHREDGFRIDAIAFVTSGEATTSAQLDALSVPEPSSTALIGLGAFGLLLRRKRS